jgi:Ca2+-binding EF-hand superfamily protein
VSDVVPSSKTFKVSVKGERGVVLRAASVADAQRWVGYLRNLDQWSAALDEDEVEKTFFEAERVESQARESEPRPVVEQPETDPKFTPDPESAESESAETPANSILSFFGFGATPEDATDATAAARPSDGEAPAPEAPAARRPNLADLFEKLDTNGDGELTQAEVVDAADSLGLTRDEAAQLFAELDADGSGKLTKNELFSARMLTKALAQLNFDFLKPAADEQKYAFALEAPQGPPTPTLSELFALLDKNGDGELSKEEVVGAADTLGMTAKEAGKLFDDLDTNGSGSLTKDKFSFNLGNLADLVADNVRNVFTLGFMGKDEPLKIDQEGRSTSSTASFTKIDDAAFEIIEKVASAVVKHGPTFETSIREKQALNSQYAFLREVESPEHAYYRQTLLRLTEEGWTLQMVQEERKAATDSSFFGFMGSMLKSIGDSDAKDAEEAQPQPMTVDKLFAKLDANGDGELTKDEVIAGADKLGMTPDEAAAMFVSMDTNGSGKLSKDEFNFFGGLIGSLEKVMPDPEKWLDSCIDLISGYKQIANEAVSEEPSQIIPSSTASQVWSFGQAEETKPEKATSRLDPNRVTEEAWYEGLVG